MRVQIIKLNMISKNVNCFDIFDFVMGTQINRGIRLEQIKVMDSNDHFINVSTLFDLLLHYEKLAQGILQI